MIIEHERQAASINDIVRAVAGQTNWLALDVEIEAVRARQHGKGFVVVADEVCPLAETSEKSENKIQNMVGKVQADVKVFTTKPPTFGTRLGLSVIGAVSAG